MPVATPARCRARWALLLLTVITGCPREEPLPPPPTTFAQAQELAATARRDAEDALEETDAEAARRAGALGAFALEHAERLAGVEAVDSSALGQVRAAARETRKASELTVELDALAGQRGGLKAKAYDGARGLALQGVFRGLALAAGQAEARGVESLPEAARESAVLAADLAHTWTGRPRRADGSPDWAGIATDMAAFAEVPPWQASLAASLAFLALGKDTFALLEVERVDAAGLPSDEARRATVLLRAIVYRINGYPRLAARELEGLSDAEAAGTGPEAQAGVHLLLAGLYVQEHDLPSADRELVRAIRVWPNNPVAVFLTGERQAASGEWERAAASLESYAAGTEDAWIAEQVAARARAIRDSRGEGESLLDDGPFMVRLAFHYVRQAAERSEAAGRAQGWVDVARGFGQRVLSGLSEPEPTPQAEAEPRVEAGPRGAGASAR